MLTIRQTTVASYIKRGSQAFSKSTPELVLFTVSKHGPCEANVLWTLGIQVKCFCGMCVERYLVHYVHRAYVQYEALESVQHLSLLLLHNVTRSAAVNAMLGNNESKMLDAAFVPKHF